MYSLKVIGSHWKYSFLNTYCADGETPLLMRAECAETKI